MRFSGIGRNSKRWQRDVIVPKTLWASVVAKMNLTCAGRLFERFQKGVERVGGQRVDFVDNVDFIGALRGA